MDNDIEPKPDTVKAYYATTIPAVRAVSARDIQPTRDACLDNLVKSRDGEQEAARR
jgi:hypothetical protein